MAGFVTQLPSVNALADSSPGFVWRLGSDTGDNTYLRPYADPLIIFNLSVWESVEMLKRYVYRAEHGSAMRDRKLWFDRMETTHFALWWIPAGHRPSVEEAKERLSYRQEHGDGPMAFSFSTIWEMPSQPAAESDEQPGRTLDFDGRVLSLRSRSELGDCGPDTLFHYRQDGSRVWATYDGDGVRFGSLVAVADANGGLRGCFQHLDANDHLRVGRYVAAPEFLPDSRLVLREDWVSDIGHGHSVLEQLDQSPSLQ